MVNPTLILVHGSWHSPKHWEPISQDLESHGFNCVRVALPSTQSPDLPPATLTDDTNAIRTAVIGELDAGNNVMVVAHSYGGCPTNNALKDLNEKSRTAAGFNTSVKTTIFISAAPLPAGTSFLQALGGAPLPIHDLRVPDFAWVGPPGPEHYFYNEMDPSEAKRWAKELRPQSWKAYEEKTSYAAYHHFEKVYYLRCRKDQALWWEAQGGLIQQIEGDGGRVVVREVDADHTPFIGKRIAETSEFIRKAAREEL